MNDPKEPKRTPAKRAKTCGKCGSAIPKPGPCPICDDSPYGRRP